MTTTNMTGHEWIASIRRTAARPAARLPGLAAGGALRRAVAAALCFVILSGVTAFADMRIVSDAGGAVTTYVARYRALTASGGRLVVDGPCLSACTLFTALVPRDRVCVTGRAALGFHAASYYDDVSRRFVATPSGTRLVLRIYPPEIRSWIERHGGLSTRILVMRGPDLAVLYPACSAEVARPSLANLRLRHSSP